MMTLPIFYSFRRCPYAIRARLALAYAEQTLMLREILLRNKPQSMLTLSPKGTVPVLLLPDGQVIDESRDVMVWALEINDPDNLLAACKNNKQIDALIDQNDIEFKPWLDRYKYFDRHPENSKEFYRNKAAAFIKQLDTLLENNSNLFGEQMSLADMAIMPFVRQFSHVDKDWFVTSPYSNCQQWLEKWLHSDLFLSVMKKYPLWDEASGENQVVFAEQG